MSGLGVTYDYYSWIIYLGASLLLVIIFFDVSRHWWVWVRHPLRIFLMALLFTPITLPNYPSNMAPAIAALSLDVFFQIGQPLAWSSLALTAIKSLMVGLIVATLCYGISRLMMKAIRSIFPDVFGAMPRSKYPKNHLENVEPKRSKGATRIEPGFDQTR